MAMMNDDDDDCSDDDDDDDDDSGGDGDDGDDDDINPVIDVNIYPHTNERLCNLRMDDQQTT